MRIAITGSTGLIGSALVRDLRADGHEVVRLVRREPAAPDEARWEPQAGPGAPDAVDPAALDGTDAVVHLAAAGIGDRRWTASYKRKIRDSRVLGTGTLAAALAARGAGDRPKTLVCGSGIGYYGDTGDREVDEETGQGSGFLAELVRDWEGACAAAEDAGIRVVHARAGLVLARQGGILGRILPIFRLGLGGRLGSGRQWMSWVSIADEVAALRFLIDDDALTGPVNIAAPHPVTNADFTRQLGRALGRPAFFVAPPFALRAALDGFADEALLTGQRAVPRRLTRAGFTFAHPDLGAALPALLKRA